MNRRSFLKSAAFGVGGSALLGFTPINPLDSGSSRRDSGDQTSTSTPTPTETSTTPPPPEHRLWSNDIYGPVTGLVTDGTGRELFVSISNKVYCIDADTGGISWYAEFEQSIEKPVALGKGTVLAVGRHGRVITIDRASGDRRWFEETNSFIPGQPVLHETTAVVPGRHIYGFNVESGEHRWSSEATFTVPTTLQNGRFLYVGSAWNLAKIDLTDGSAVWIWGDRERGHAPSQNFILDPNRGYLYGTYNWQFFAVDVQTGKVVWESRYDYAVQSFHRHEDILLSTAETDADNTKLVALDLSGPALLWEKIAPLDVADWDYGQITTKLAGYADRVVAGTSTGHLVMLDPFKGELVATTRLFKDSVRRLHTHDDRAYVIGPSTLYGIDLGEI